MVIWGVFNFLNAILILILIWHIEILKDDSLLFLWFFIFALYSMSIIIIGVG